MSPDVLAKNESIGSFPGCVAQIADEAHGVRSDTTGRYQRLRKLSSKRKLLLTGTPVQNNLSELFVMMRFAMPSVFLEEDAV